MNSSRSNRLLLAARANAINEKSSLNFFQNGVRGHRLSNGCRSAMVHVNRSADRSFAIFAKRSLRLEACEFHPRDHPRRGKNRRQLRVVRRQRVLVFDDLGNFISGTDWHIFSHKLLGGTFDYTRSGKARAIQPVRSDIEPNKIHRFIGSGTFRRAFYGIL
jgi:hypothetical protein